MVWYEATKALGPRQMAIPKIIHQTLNNKYELNPIFKANIEKLKYHNLNWEHRLYDDNDQRKFISNCYGADFLQSFDKINALYGAARADFFRYLLMYELGGVYLDIKSTSNKKLDDVLQEDESFVLSRWANKDGERYQGWGRHPEFGVESEYQQWHIIAAPRHPFLKSVISIVKINIDEYKPIRDGVGQIGVLRLTGPIAYTLAIEAIKKFHKHRLVDITNLGFEHSIVPDIPLSTIGNLYGREHYSILREPIVWVSTTQQLAFYVRNILWGLGRTLLPKSLHRGIKLLCRLF